eukprot:TRINITY_DN20447_c0_g1_i1.p1 TRINITY_DN20447_c0_g1~~TRINITY_DN20447_c0_g1_i1.p1  ORF type:complete len:157 (-),score=28.49 TRINITY_DN20447_c0_g1_i1:522-944(-)
MTTMPGTTVSLEDQAAQTTQELDNTNADLQAAENLSGQTEEIANTIDAITGGGQTTVKQRLKRAGDEITTPTDCSSFLILLKEFNTAIGNNPRKANITKGGLIAAALTSVDKDSISCDAEEVSSLKVMKQVAVKNCEKVW